MAISRNLPNGGSWSKVWRGRISARQGARQLDILRVKTAVGDCANQSPNGKIRQTPARQKGEILKALGQKPFVRPTAGEEREDAHYLHANAIT